MPTLAKYRKMRDFSRTAEPKGESHRGARPAAGFSYVIQKHAATRLHYDFRLELDGVLLSWAVPKGPSLDPSVKRLAVETEPHPLEYGGFEGTIAKGQYGGGTVMVWDRGSWEPAGDANAGYQKGHLNFTLHGDKLQGAWHLVRTARQTKEGKNWLLFKSDDDFAEPGENTILERAPNSALSGRDLDQIAAGKPAKKTKASSEEEAEEEPASTRRPRKAAEKKSTAKSSPGKKSPRKSSAGKSSRPPSSIEPELATLVDTVPAGDDWLHEIKFDGYRLLVLIDHGKVRLLTRKGLDWTERIPTLARAFSELELDSAILDGEFVALDERGHSDFQALQNSLSQRDDATLVYYAFDLLYRDGRDLRAEPLTERKAALKELLAQSKRSAHIRLSEHVVGDGERFFAQAKKLGLEGIVSKRAASPYRSGRGHDWLKIKCLLRQEFVIAGFTDPGGSRSHLGALLLAVREKRDFVYAGRVGTGFNEKSLRELANRLKPLIIDQPALSNPPRGAEARGVHWVKPELVAEVAFTGFTQDRLLRHPTFQGLREDKSASEVVLETPAHEESHEAESSAKRAKPAASKQRYPLTNPDKILYPEQGISKRELADYYELVAERMLPHVANRPLTLVRCPNGRGKACFFQKHPGEGVPPGLRSIDIREKEGKAPYSVIDDVEGLLGLVQLGALEIHTWGSRADDFEHPDILVFDLDPAPELPFSAVIDAAQHLHEVFGASKLQSFVKTTGGKGLHVCIPIKPRHDWEAIKGFTQRVAQTLAVQNPKRYVSTVSKAQRKGKIFIDYLRNGRGATFIAPYSTRARENAPVACPVEWDELTAKFDPLQFTLRNASDWIARHRRDPFAALLAVKQGLPELKGE